MEDRIKELEAVLEMIKFMNLKSILIALTFLWHGYSLTAIKDIVSESK
jgi:hypothetical protein